MRPGWTPFRWFGSNILELAAISVILLMVETVFAAPLMSGAPSLSDAPSEATGTAKAENALEVSERTAAETDWVSLESLNEQQRLDLPWYCNGAYRQPDWLGVSGLVETGDPTTMASAEQADHQVDGKTFLQGCQSNNKVTKNRTDRTQSS